LFDQAPKGVGHVDDLVWSPDGSRLAFSAQEGGIWVVGVDGSGLTKVIPHGVNPAWSPDGSRISYERTAPGSFVRGALEIAGVDGRHVQEFGYGGSGPWNPLPLSVPGNHGARATAGRGYAGPFVSILALLALVGLLVLARRSRRKLTEP
jgi:WD40-like Beta Propeller Repeat